MSLEGQQLGEFEILERLGQGGMGAVYKARQVSLGRLVALKTLQTSLADDAEYIARFQQEARAAAVLDHPNLVQVYSAGESAGLHWFAMQYVEGESAKVRLKRKGRLDPLEAIAIAIHVATALDYGWRKAALIHRDIKPDNIFLSSDGEVKLGDLGLAKSVGQAADLTATGHSMGTPHYISPEQVVAMKEVDLRADIYSLGCTLYHLVSGQAPFEGNSAVAIMMQHVHGPVPDLRAAWPECPQELANVVGKMMQKPPAERQQNYEEVIADLRRGYDSLSGASVPSVLGATRQPVVVRRPIAGQKKSAVSVGWVVGALMACAALAALLYFGPRKTGGQHPEAALPEKQKAVQNDTQRTILTGQDTPAVSAGGKTLAVATAPPPDATPAPATPMPAPATPMPTTQEPSATPKPLTDVEKWFAQVDGPQQETFQKQVLKPFETGVADLRARYLAALDAAVAKASAAGQLAEALVWRTERQGFEKAQNVADDEAETPPGVKTLRAAFREQLAKIDQDRTTQAKARLAPYDAILAKYQTLLTQHQRLDDALLLKTKRDAIALAWLGTSQPVTVVVAAHPEPAKSGDVLLASKEHPFVNSLGMTFVPVPILGGPTDGQHVLFSVWDTRVQDYEVFATGTGRDWAKPGFEQGPTHPAANVGWEDAQAFCTWLTERERKAGKLSANEAYRLPSDHEWSCAVGIGEREVAAKLPIEKNEKINNAFPWGSGWPPPKGAGNYIGEETGSDIAIKGYNDGFKWTSPVGSFKPNKYGLYDMGGNLFQWCEDWFDASHKDRVVRGASWLCNVRGVLLSSYRGHLPPGRLIKDNGFRCVLEMPAK